MEEGYDSSSRVDGLIGVKVLEGNRKHSYPAKQKTEGVTFKGPIYTGDKKKDGKRPTRRNNTKNIIRLLNDDDKDGATPAIATKSGNDSHRKENNTPTKNRTPKSRLALQRYEYLLEQQLVEEAADAAIDAVVQDFIRCKCNCAILEENSKLRQALRTKKTWFPEPTSSLTKIQSGDYIAKLPKEYRLSKKKTIARESSLRLQMEILDALSQMSEIRAPVLALTKRQIFAMQKLPQRDVTLYIKLNEEIPKNACTAYEVDMKRFERGETTKLFRYFRICPLPKDNQSTVADGAFSNHKRMEQIICTIASGCLYPYTMANGGSLLDTTTCQRTQGFRPTNILMDEERDIPQGKLKLFLQETLGIWNCQLVDPKLRALHEDSDSDFFHHDSDNDVLAGAVNPEGLANNASGRGVNACAGKQEEDASSAPMTGDPLHCTSSVEELFADYDDMSLKEITSLLSQDEAIIGTCGAMMCFGPSAVSNS